MSFRERYLPHFDPKQPTNLILVLLIIIVGTLIVVELAYGIMLYGNRATLAPAQPSTSPDLTTTNTPAFTTDQKLQILQRMATSATPASSSVVESNRPSVLQHVQANSTTSASERSKRLEILQQMQQ